ncbi:MAG TPA: ATP-dependent DNA helicase [Woeseiaceae bacterium]|nr:ATP-dependent DNA helicase [Woeseiaceae bacterium]
MTSLRQYFAAGSPLTRWLPGFQPRSGQFAMAEAVAAALAQRGKLVIEAGTGTGKTFAYLIPALLGGQKTIISTGTKALQDQLYHRDLPLVGKALGRPVSTALLKGRANYLCLYRLDEVAGEHVPATGYADLAAVRAWRHRTVSGDRSELADIPEDSPVWPWVTSTADNCLGRECPFFEDCHVVQARRAAQDADLVVVNHHLLLADLAMKEEGFVEFLPETQAVILDEAHQVPDLAAQFFGVSLGSRDLERLLGEVRAATLPLAQRELDRRLDQAETAVKVLRAEAPAAEGRHQLAELGDRLEQPLRELRGTLQSLQEAVGGVAEASPEIAKLHERLWDASERLAQLVADDAWDGLRWVDVHARSLRLNLTPLDVSGTLQNLFGSDAQAWIFTSATLAVGEDFSHFAGRIGLPSVNALAFPSPYALDRHGLVYLPPGLPAPSDPEHTSRLLERVMPLLRLTAGGAFFLFTSHRALETARGWFRTRKRRLDGRPLLVQGEAPRDDLLRRFREHGNAVLLGTGSFWEGVDVRGPALSIVAIDKLPFASPGDPLMMARLEFIKRQGGNGFTEHQLPQAALALKQGAGRLLRDHADYGVIVLGDPRVTSKSYGSVFLESLAPMPCTTSEAEVRAFFERHAQAAADESRDGLVRAKQDARAGRRQPG